jgi:hypothetical protein
MEDRRVLDSSTRMGILLKRVREQYEEDENWYRAAQKEIGNLKRLNAGLIERLKKK